MSTAARTARTTAASTASRRPTPPTMAVTAALRAIHRELPEYPADPDDQPAFETFDTAVNSIFSKVASATLRQSRSRYRSEEQHRRVAAEFIRAIVRATRWADELASIPPNPRHASPDRAVHTALVAALAQRIVVDGVNVAPQVMATCRRAVRAQLAAAGSPGSPAARREP